MTDDPFLIIVDTESINGGSSLVYLKLSIKDMSRASLGFAGFGS